MKNVEPKSSVAVLNKEVTRELADPAVARALLATTFNGLEENVMRQAILEGMIRGFKFKDFLEKNVYAIPYGQKYSLVTSIDYARKIGMRSGVVGKSAPVYTMDGKKIESCSITIKRKVSGEIGEFTSLVFFDEYTTGRNLWTSKPRTMIAKVAEMHALRMACPEEMSQLYTAEEFDKEKEKDYDRSDIEDDAIPTIHVGEQVREYETNMVIDEKPRADDVQYEIPEDEAGQKTLIKALVMKKWPNLDTKDAKAFKSQIADYTELEYVPSNYPAIIKHLR